MSDPEDLVATLEGTVDRLKVIAKEREGIPLNDDVQEVLHLCETVESIIRHLQKEKVNFWGERRDYWHYLTEGLGNIKELDSCVKVVQALPQLTTAQGKGRALIRECLSEQLLADCVQHSVGNSKRTKEWYHVSAILLLPSLTQRVLSALYDLSEVTFELPLEGVELDEHWPSFTLKSFNSPVRSTPENKAKSSSLFNVLGSTLEAKAAGKGKPARRPLLERAIEEQPTEIFVKHEVPFNIELVGSLLANIRSNLIGQDFGQSPTHPAPKTAMLPELQVSKLDDITSCLTVLSDYVTSWSHDVAKDSRTMKNELRELKDKVADLELQLQETINESETSECSLLEKITDSHSNLRSCNSVRHLLVEENESFQEQLAKARSRVSELEMMNFDLEEQLVRSDIADGEAEARQRALTVVEYNLTEKEKEVEDLSKQLEQQHEEVEHLQAQLTELQSQLQAKAKVEELHQQSESQLKEKTSEMEDLLRKQSELEAQNADLDDKISQLNAALEELKAEKDLEIDGLKKRLELESEQRMNLEQERNQARKDISSMQGQIELETSSLRFQMSSQTLEVQTAKEAVKKKDKVISELRSELIEMETKVSEANGRHKMAEEKLEELRQEMKDVESLLQTNQDEMMSLHEQLTESNASRDNQRAEMLKLQNMADNFQSELKRQVDTLTTENDDIRKAFKKLLEQKVTLWQHADELEQEQVSMGTWIDDKDVSDCMACGSNFTAFKRKHHCRSCGKVFCSKCCEQKAQLPVSKDPVRVCDKCHEKIEHVRTPYAAKMINSLDAESLSQTIGLAPPNGNLLGGSQRSSRGGSRGGSRGELDLMCNGVSRNSLNIERRSVDLGGNSLHAKLMLQNSDEYSASSTPNLSRLEATLLSQDDTLSSRTDGGRGSGRGTFSIDYDAESIRSVNSMDYSVDPEVKQREAVKEQLLLQDVGEDMSVRISTIEGETTDDSYYIIETNPEASFPVGLDTHGTQHLDVNALASKLASIEVARKSEEEVSPSGNSTDDPLLGFGSPLRSVSRNSQAIATGNLEYKEVMMQGGGIHSVPITIEKCGTAIAWEFNTEPKGIAFGIVYKSASESSKEDELLPLKRCSSHKAVLTGEYIAQKAGIYILKFDNRHSKYSGRKLLYKIWLKHML